MIHWPTPFDWRSTDTWKAFVKLRDEGMARTLGVCNFMPADLKRLHGETGAWPAVNQIELHLDGPTRAGHDPLTFTYA